MTKQVMYLAAVGAQALASAALIPVLTHGLSQADYGRIAFVAVGQQFVTTLLALGLPGLVTSWESGGEERELRRGAALPVLLLGGVCTVAASLVQSAVFTFVFLLGTMNALASLVLARVAAQARASIWAALTVGIGPVSVAAAAGAAVSTNSFSWYLGTWTLGIAICLLLGLRWADPAWFESARLSVVTRRAKLSLPLAVSLAAAVALAAGDRLIVGAVLGDAALARYQAAYAVGNLAVMAGLALTNHWLPALMRGEPAARKAHLLTISAFAGLGAGAAGPTLAILLPESYAPWSLWPVAAIAAGSAIPQAWFLQAQARSTHLGDTRAVGVGALVVTGAAMALTLLIAHTSGSFEMIATVTPVSYAVLATALWRRSRPHAATRTGRPVVVLLSSIRWCYLWQRHQSLAVAALHTADVVFVESQPRRLRQLVTYPAQVLLRRGRGISSTPPPEGIRLVKPSPLAVITPGLWARSQARGIRAQAGDAQVDVILYAPSRAYLALARRLTAEGARVAYDAVIDWSLAPAHFHPPRGSSTAEARLPAAWRVVSDNAAVAEDLGRRLGRTVQVVSPAADEAFLSHLWTDLAAREPVVGWFGAIHAEMDADLLCAASRAGLRVEAVGPVEDEAVADQLTAAGVTVRPAVSIEALPGCIQHWRVALLAYRGPRADTITPAKLLNALVGFRVAVRGIAVPQDLAGITVELPTEDVDAVTVLKDLVEFPGHTARLSPDQLSWRARLGEVLGAAR